MNLLQCRNHQGLRYSSEVFAVVLLFLVLQVYVGRPEVNQLSTNLISDVISRGNWVRPILVKIVLEVRGRKQLCLLTYQGLNEYEFLQERLLSINRFQKKADFPSEKYSVVMVV